MNKQPNKKPRETGKNAVFSQFCVEYSSDGTSSDQMDAESMMPEARPIVMTFNFFDVGLKKNTHRAPKVVAKQGKIRPNAINMAEFIVFCDYSP